jgi:hypothetical protein
VCHTAELVASSTPRGCARSCQVVSRCDQAPTAAPRTTCCCVPGCAGAGNHAVVPELRLDVFPDLRAHVGRPRERPGTSLARDPNRATSTETDMTATAPIIITPTENNPWAENLAAQKTRFPNAKDSILFAIAALQDNPDIAIDDLKTLASQQGIRVTAASVNAAKRLLDPENATAPVAAPAGLNPAPARERCGETSSGRRSPAGRQRVDPGRGRQDPGAGERRGRTNARGGAEGDHRARSRRRILRHPAPPAAKNGLTSATACSRRAPPRSLPPLDPATAWFPV